MRRVLVPIDGSDLSQSIIPDARRLAGPDGELVLIRDASEPGYDPDDAVTAGVEGYEESENYLDALATTLRADGARVLTQTFVMGTPERAILEAIGIFRPDMVACATHARHGLDRLMRGSVAWTVLTHSPVPVLLRHPRHLSAMLEGDHWYRRRILVPLDGSALAEKALPLAETLAAEWNASVCLARVVSDAPLPTPLGFGAPVYAPEIDHRAEMRDADEYLEAIAKPLRGEVHRATVLGNPIPTLKALVDDWWITDIVMATHGRTGFSHVLLGSVTDALLQTLDIPIVAVPALAAAPHSDAAEPAAVEPVPEVVGANRA
ncbi:MAG TPA: universal stress protein [Chloroflexota bacterium]|nr:universal stress protein [Chloroflexota bacterium]